MTHHTQAKKTSKPDYSEEDAKLSHSQKQKVRPRFLWPSVLLTGAIGVGVAIGVSLLWWRSQIRPVQAQAESQTLGVSIVIPEGTAAYDVGHILQEKKLIHSLTAWKLWTRWAELKQSSGGFQAGTYELRPTDSLPTLAQTIWSGKVKEDFFTIPEGWRIKQMAQLFEQEKWFTADQFQAAVDRALAQPPQWLPQSVNSLEGFLFPDTYQIPVDARTPDGVVAAMLQRFEQVALPIYESSANPGNLSLQNWVTLASIIEKEAVVAEERPIISGVFVNRLAQGIPLGSDPTVEYGLGISQTKDQPLTFAQVETPSPFNTYLNAGLTPTPIASPGVASLKVALEPAKTDYLYFVARYDGTHVFTKTLAEHQRAQDEIWDKIEAQNENL